MLPAAAYYNNLAPIYDEATKERWTPNAVLEPYLAGLAMAGCKALDIGCGTGQTIAILLKAGVSPSVAGIDISENMLTTCAQKYPTAHLLLGQLIEVEARLAAASFDIITCIGTFEFVADSRAFLAAVARLLKPTGHFFFTYEPIIAFHEIQNARESEVVPGDAASKAGVAAKGFVSYRRDPLLLESELSDAGFRKTVDVEFVAYRKHSVPIIYHLVCAQPSGSNN